jgi:ribosomal protein S18 acetylase RimI-like enzyme/8-oxo-dGTP pyrophosphatase MutT (NUDIX family)
MNITIRLARADDARTIVMAEREIAQEPGFFCSKPSELDEDLVRATIEDNYAIYLVAESDGAIVGHAFLMTLHLHTLRHVAQLNIAVHHGWQNRGIGRKLIEALIERAKQSPIEKIELQVRATNQRAIALYKKMGFREEGRLKKRLKTASGYLDDLVMAMDLQNSIEAIKVSRTGVYGAAIIDNRILLVTQQKGPYAGKLDFPGGGIKFAETIEAALRREFQEETQMTFASMELMDNLTVFVEKTVSSSGAPMDFHQIGMIYKVFGVCAIDNSTPEELPHAWYDISSLHAENSSPFVWTIAKKLSI